MFSLKIVSIQHQFLTLLQKKQQYNKMKSFLFKNPIKKKLILSHPKNPNEKHSQNNENSPPNLQLCTIALKPEDEEFTNMENHKKTYLEKPLLSSPFHNSTIRIKRSFSPFQNVQTTKIVKNTLSVDKLQKNASSIDPKPLKPNSAELNMSPKELTSELISQLKKQHIIQRQNLKFYSIKRTEFQEILEILFAKVFMINKEQRKSLSSRSSHTNNVDQFLSRLQKIMEQTALKQKQSKLKIIHEFQLLAYQPESYASNINEYRQQLQNLLKKKEENYVAIMHQQETNSSCQRQIEINMDVISKQIGERNDLEEAINLLSEKQAAILNEISEYSKILEQTKTTSDKITNFIGEQNNQILKLISADYKQIQSDIYEYASYLQANQLANDIDYEPVPFTHIEDELLEEMKNINKSILQETNIDVTIKSKLMRDFILQVIEKFKKKDSEMGKLLKFRTKCIRTFINSMKKWLDNWSLKQQYLVNLRNQFLIDTTKFNQAVEKLKQMEFCKICRQRVLSQIEIVSELYKKIELNYKMGNSFY